MAERLRIAWFSRMDSPESPSAYFTALTLPNLTERFDVELFDTEEREFLGRRTRHFLKAAASHAENPFDIFFYQLENAKEAHFVRFHLGLQPGVVMFHDLFLSDEGPEPLLESHWRAFVARYEEAARGWPERGSKPPAPPTPGTREAALAVAAIFTSERNQEEYRRMSRQSLAAPGRTYFLPWPVAEDLASPSPGGALRTVGFCGGPRIEHRAHKVLGALAECKEPPKLVWLISDCEKHVASELLAEHSVRDCELVTGRSPERWSEVVGRCDAAIHTLFSMHGHPWPYLAISMMAGRPCIVTRFGHTERISERAVFKIDPGPCEATQIREVLERLRTEDCAALGWTGKEMVREESPSRVVAAGLAEIFAELAARLRPERKRWEAMERDAMRAVIEESKSAALSGFHAEPIFGEAVELWDVLYRGAFRELWPALPD